MQQRQLGTGGPMVSALGLGTFSFGGAYGPTDMAESHAALDAAWDHGITFLDTANIYGKGVAETVIGSWLHSRKHRPLIVTKAGFTEDPQKRVDNSPAFLRSCLDASLKRLGVDHVALFYAHRHDPEVPAEDLAGTMQRLQEEGKILGYGLSEVAPYTLERAHAVHPVTAVQNEYSLWTRQPELGLIQRCQSLGVAFVPFSPLARGAFGTPCPTRRPSAPTISAAASRAIRARTGSTTAPDCKPSTTSLVTLAIPLPPCRLPGCLTVGLMQSRSPAPAARRILRIGSRRHRAPCQSPTAPRSTGFFPSAGPGVTATTTRKRHSPNAIPDRSLALTGRIASDKPVRAEKRPHGCGHRHSPRQAATLSVVRQA